MERGVGDAASEGEGKERERAREREWVSECVEEREREVELRNVGRPPRANARRAVDQDLSV